MDQMLQLSILCRQSVQLVDVEFAKLFDVQGSSVSVRHVVELGVVLVHLGLFGIIKPISSTSVPLGGTATHAAMSSAPKSFRHFSLFCHMRVAFGRSNLRARRNRRRVISSNRS